MNAILIADCLSVLLLFHRTHVLLVSALAANDFLKEMLNLQDYGSGKSNLDENLLRTLTGAFHHVS